MYKLVRKLDQIEKLKYGREDKAAPDATCVMNARAFLEYAIDFNYPPTNVKPVALTSKFGAVGVTYCSTTDSRYGYLEFNHDDRFGLMLTKAQSIVDADKDQDYYFESFPATVDNFRMAIVKVYKHFNEAP